VVWARVTDTTRQLLAGERHGRDTTRSTFKDTDRYLSGSFLWFVLLQFAEVVRFMAQGQGLANA
jgi:hypothetical protein